MARTSFERVYTTYSLGHRRFSIDYTRACKSQVGQSDAQDPEGYRDHLMSGSRSSFGIGDADSLWDRDCGL